MGSWGTQVAVVDGGTALLWLAANLLLAVFSCRVSRRLFAADGLAVQGTAALVLFLSIILLAVIALGAVGLLSGWLLLGLVGAVAILGLWRGGLTRGVVVPAANSVTFGAPADDRRGLFWVWVWTFAFAFAVTHVLLTGLLEFPSNFDTLMYHLPIVDQWLQAGSLYAPNSSYWWTPGTSEVVALWMVAPFSGDFLAALNNLPFVVLWGMAGLALAYQLGLPRPAAHLAALVSLFTYNTLDELNDGQNDLAIVALFLAGACFGLRYLQRRRTTDLVWFAMAVGALCGVKYNALGYAALLVAAVVALSLVQRDLRAAGRAAAASTLGFLLLSGYWYVRNWLVGASPIYPMGLGHDIATAYPDIWSTTFLGNGDPRVPQLAIAAVWRMTGPLHLVGVLLTPLLAAYFAFRSFGSRRSSPGAPDSRLTSAFLFLLLSASAFLLLITPFCLEDQPRTLNHLQWAYTPTRYGLSFLSLVVLALFHLAVDVWDAGVVRRWLARRGVGRLPGSSFAGLLLGCRRVDVPALLLLVGLVAWQIALRIMHNRDRFDFLTTGLVALNLSVLVLVLTGPFSRFRWSRRGGVVVVCLALAAGAGFLSQQWHAGYGVFYDRFFGTRVFRRAELQPIWGDRVCVLELRVYPFFGSRRQTRVLRPRIVSSPESLANYLQRHDIRVVSTRASDREKYYLYTDTLRWLRNDAAMYTLVAGEGHYWVFTVRSPEAADFRSAHRGNQGNSGS